MLTATLTDTILTDNTFDIEFQGYLSNHAKHAIVALSKLQAPDARIQEYWNQYTTLTPYHLKLEKAILGTAPCTLDEWKSLKGQKKEWQNMILFLQEELKKKDEKDNVNLLVKQFAPDLLSGMAGALTHGIIHLGWAIDAKSDWMTLEGLAYLNYCHLGIDESTHKFVDNAFEEKEPMESYQRVAADFHSQNLQQTWIEETKAKYGEDFHPELVPAGFQWQLSKVLANPHNVATHLPSWLGNTNMQEAWNKLYRTSTWLYLATRDKDGNGNFLVLHLLTSLWGVEQVCRVIDCDTVTRNAWKHYYAMLVCVVCTSAGGFPATEVLEQVQKDFPSDNNSDDDFSWDPIVQRAFKEEEEHNIKLVYLMKELWKRDGKWKGFSEAANSFTLTPNIGPRATAFSS